LIGRLASVAALLAGFATLAIVLLVSYDVTMRYFFDKPQIFVDEVASFLEVLVVFGGAAYTFRAGGHVRVDLVTGLLAPAVRAWLRVITLTLGVLFLAVVIWVTTRSAGTAWSYGRVSAVMLYPLWWPWRCSRAWAARRERRWDRRTDVTR
jgi:TRAP-type C4-dicarboxylate transport system permease small subunit